MCAFKCAHSNVRIQKDKLGSLALVGLTLKNIIAKLPKAELHVHIEGTLEPEMMFELARRNHVAMPYKSHQELEAAYQFSDLQSFLDIYYQGMEALVQEVDFYDLAFA